MYQLILASRSPRRQKILTDHGLTFLTRSVEISEIVDKNLSIPKAIEQIAQDKSEALVQSDLMNDLEKFVILTADTIVALNKKVLGKPKDEQEAVEMLMSMSGRTHQVVTGVCFYDSVSKKYTRTHLVSDVEFFDLSTEQIQTYVESGDPMDKAGSYGIQSQGRQFVKNFTGPMDNIAGLPMGLVKNIFSKNPHWGLSVEI